MILKYHGLELKRRTEEYRRMAIKKQRQGTDFL
jgi:hypothetical protein